MVALLLLGLLAYRILPVSALPQVDYPTIQVVTFYSGASPDVMASTVTAPLERQFGQIPGLAQISSTSSGGASVIVLRFALGLDIDVAEQDVQAAINTAGSYLPADLPAPPIYSKVNPADAPILSFAVTSDVLPLSQVQELVDTRLAQRISQISGVGLVRLSGGRRRAVRVRANPKILSAYGLSLEDLRAAIGTANVNQPKGMVESGSRTETINTNDQLHDASEYADIIIAYRNGAPVRLSDVAQVANDVENTDLAAWANRTPAILMNVQKQPGTNVIEVADRIKALLPELRADLPSSVRIEPLTDRTENISASVRDVQHELLLSIVLVILVIFGFLKSARATVIPAIVVPLSLVGTFAVMYLADFSVNNLTLMALTIAAGFVVDDAIVVIENISRHLEQGESPLQATLKGSEQIGFTILSLTLSLVAVLIPLLFMGDVVGRLFREFAVTLAVAILISAAVSLTLTPTMCAKLLRHGGIANEGPVMSAVGHIFDRVLDAYKRALDWVLLRQGPTLLFAALTLFMTVILYMWVPKGFFPIQDTGLIQVVTEAPANISFSAMAARQQDLASAVLQDPAVESVSSFVGIDGVNTTLNSGRLLVALKPRPTRGDTIAEVNMRLRARLSEVPDIKAYLQPVQDLTIESRPSRAQYQFTLGGADPAELGRWSGLLKERLVAAPEFYEVASDLQENAARMHVEIDRSTASRLGVTLKAIDDTLYDAFGQRLVSTIFTQSNQYRVVLEANLSNPGPDTLGDLRVPSTNGAQVPLSALARIDERVGPLVLNRLDQFPAATLSFNLASGASLEQAVRAIERAKDEIGMPISIRTEFHGATSAFRDSLAGTLWLIVAAIVTVYIVLGVLYESYIHPLTILSTLPSAGIGALLALILAGSELGIVAIIGIILLIGIVKKNAIMMIDFALDAERIEGKSPHEAIVQACLLRFRPILMTTMAALLGSLPLMLGSGVGSELRHPLGLTMVGGLIVSQCLTLFTTPVIYLAFDRLKRRLFGIGTAALDAGV